AFVDPQCCALLRVGVGTVHNGILQDSVRIPKCPLSPDFSLKTGTAPWGPPAGEELIPRRGAVE
ncbi:hypothetical protein, partial [Corynebacterium diphtheriae]